MESQTTVSGNDTGVYGEFILLQISMIHPLTDINDTEVYGEFILLQISIINSGKNIKKNYLKVMNKRQNKTRRYLILDKREPL